MNLPLSTTPYAVQNRDNPFSAPLNPLVHITHQPSQPHNFLSSAMADYLVDYMTVHASAYPPATWAFHVNRQPKAPQTSANELWTEMTGQYERSMVERQRLFTKNFLSESATKDNIGRMSPKVEKLYCQRAVIAFEDAAQGEEILEMATQFFTTVDELSRNPMKTIPEEDESGATHSQRQPTQTEVLQTQQAILKAKKYQTWLQGVDKVKESFRARLLEIHSDYHAFICTPVGKHPRPRWAQICRIDKEASTNVAHVAHVRRQLISDVAQLKDFLRGQLFDEYCLMRGTAMVEKDETWLKYGKCLVLELEIGKGEKSLTKETAENFEPGEREVGHRLDRLMKASALDPNWVMDRIKDYYAGNDHIGKWQRYVQACCWKELAAKLTKDIQQLEKINSTINSSNSRRCKIMLNMRNTGRQFFKRLEGAQDFELSEKALMMEE